ncbi:hypothetical protein BDF19DRAFT_454672 [Syncephalis fuscata]|nr:hypothetical protein BDF19DRAFT_454672 [Syncephalis fuscata]
MWQAGNGSYAMENVPISHLGKFNAIQYFEAAGDDLAEMRSRVQGIFIQLLINTGVLYLFLRNTWHALRMLYARPTLVPAWCCFVQSAMGISFGCLFLMTALPNGRPATQAILANQRSRTLLVAGIVLMLPQPFLIYVVWRLGSATMDPIAGCSAILPVYFPWLKFGLDVSLNIVFSAAFINVVYRHYRLFGSEAWKQLTEDGVRTMCLIILSNIVCLFIVTFKFIGNTSETWWIADWAITSVLLVNHTKDIRNGLALTHSGQTNHNTIASSQLQSFFHIDLNEF